MLENKKPTSKRIQRLTAKRNNRVDTYLHQASRWIIDFLDSKGIGKLIIGQNPLWKQKVNTGNKNNQSFVSIPHARFVEMLIYKGQIKGIEVVCREESYTSKASFLNLDFTKFEACLLALVNAVSFKTRAHISNVWKNKPMTPHQR